MRGFAGEQFEGAPEVVAELGRALVGEVRGLASVRVRDGRGEGGRAVAGGLVEGHFGCLGVTLEVAAHGVPGRHPHTPAGAVVCRSVTTRGARLARGHPVDAWGRGGRAEACEAGVVLEVVDAGGEIPD